MRPPDLTGNSEAFAALASDPEVSNKQQNTTGRHTIVFRKGDTQKGIEFLRNAGFKVFVSKASDPKVVREDEVGDADVIVSSTLGVALVGGEPEQIRQLESMASDSDGPILTITPEKVRQMLEVPPGIGASEPDAGAMLSLGYLRGCRDTYADLMERVAANGGQHSPSSAADTVSGFDESQSTWGLQATRVVDSPFSGRGVRVAVLDTGIDFTDDENGQRRYHPDFEGRTIHSSSFVFGVQTARDGNGHGTHCIGTACGPRRPSTSPGYGIACDAEIYAGKVLNDAGSGADGWIIAGIEWAINQGCRIVSMSLGSEKNPGDTFNEAYEEIAQRALEAGTIIIAAAGNDSARPSLVRPVSGPADCPSIMAVAALDADFRLARFSNAGVNAGGGEVNIAAPGVSVHSSFLRPPGHKRLQGTSMATPHVAGIAALFAEANPSATAVELWESLTGAVKQLPLGPRDVGKGFVQAPVNFQPAMESPGKRVVQNRPLGDGGIVTIEQTSPITVGGGGSVGLDFDKSHYKQNGSGSFVSPQDRLTTCDVVHQNGKLLRNFYPEINGNQCVVIISCRDSATGILSEIRIAGGPSGQLAVGFPPADFPPGVANQPEHYSATRKVLSVNVQNVLTGATALYDVPADWAGTIRIEN
jgi:subtilisin family serine protease